MMEGEYKMIVGAIDMGRTVYDMSRRVCDMSARARIITLFFFGGNGSPYNVGDLIESGVRDGYDTFYEFPGQATVIEVKGWHSGPSTIKWEVKAIYYF